MEGKGPKRKGKGGNRAQQASEDKNSLLNDAAYMVGTDTFAKSDWLLDLATTSHICMNRAAFITYKPINDVTVQGVGSAARVHSIGIVAVNFNVNGTKF